MEKNPKISVVIPAFNVEKYIGMCLDSLLAQSYANWEAFIMDGGSADSTYDIIKFYADNDSRFHIFKDKTKNVTETRNKLLDKITDTDFLVFMDSDDFIHPQTFEAALYIYNRTKADIVEYKYFRPEAEDTPADYVKPLTIDTLPVTMIKDLNTFLCRSGRQGQWSSCWNKLFNYSVIKDIRFNEDLSYEDDVFFNTIVNSVAKNKAIIQKEMYFWRKNPVSLTGNLNYPRYIQCAVTRMQATWDYFVTGGRVPDDKKQEFMQDMANDFYRMTIKKTIRHIKDKKLQKELFPIISNAWLNYINNGIIKPDLLHITDRMTLKLFLSGKYKTAKVLSYLHF
jgi:glycosyltransferase involved in cell wall biosynthesis